MESESYFLKKGFVNLLAYKETFPIVINLINFLENKNKDDFIIKRIKEKLLDILENLASGYNEFNKLKKLEYYRIARSNVSSVQSDLLVLIDLKIGTIKHQDIGQMNAYLNYFKKEENRKEDNAPIGIILVTNKNDIDLEYALGGMTNKLFVSKYKLYLPTKEELKGIID